MVNARAGEWESEREKKRTEMWHIIWGGENILKRANAHCIFSDISRFFAVLLLLLVMSLGLFPLATVLRVRFFIRLYPKLTPLCWYKSCNLVKWFKITYIVDFDCLILLYFRHITMCCVYGSRERGAQKAHVLPYSYLSYTFSHQLFSFTFISHSLIFISVLKSLFK